jgi:hypothetical protein
MVTENRLKTLQGPDQLKSLCQSLAMLDAIMSPDWEYRHYSFDSKWDLNEMMASMKRDVQCLLKIGILATDR